MAAETTVQGVYAEALLQVAQEQNDLDVVKKELDEIIPALVDDTAVSDFLLTPNIAREKKAEIVKRVLDGKASTRVMNFLLTVIRRGRQEFLGAIYEEFLVLYRRAKNILVVEVVTARTLDDDQKEKLSGSLKKRYKREIELAVRIDPSIIGGLQIRAGGDFVDASLQFRLKQVKARFGAAKVQSGDFYED